MPDLRGGFSHLIAALAAEGTSTVHGIDLINRGYERFTEKLEALGAAAKLELTPATGGQRMVSPGPMPTTQTRVAARPASSSSTLTRCPTRR